MASPPGDGTCLGFKRPGTGEKWSELASLGFGSCWCWLGLAWFGLAWFGLVFVSVCLFACLFACLFVCLFLVGFSLRSEKPQSEANLRIPIRVCFFWGSPPNKNGWCPSGFPSKQLKRGGTSNKAGRILGAVRPHEVPALLWHGSLI